MPRIVLWYVAREFLFSFLISFVFFFVVFFINQILLLAEDILSKNAPLGETVLLLLYSLPSVIAIAFPFSALAGALMTSARLNSDNEILAFVAAGVRPSTLFLPFVIAGLAAAALSFSANDYFLPRGSKAFRSLYGQMVARSASMELEPFSVKQYPNAIVVTGAKEGSGVSDVLLFETESPQTKKAISARRATLSILPDGSEATISMEEVTEHSLAPDRDDAFSISSAKTVAYRFALREPIVGFSSTGPTEMGSRQLAAAIEKKNNTLILRISDVERQRSEARARLVGAYGSGNAASAELPLLRQGLASYRQSLSSNPTDRSLRIYQLEFNKKFAIPAAGFFFALLAFPLGLGARRAGRTAGFGIALLISAIYWGMLFAGQTAGLRSAIPPELAIWAPNGLVMLSAVIAWAARRAATRRML